VRGYEFLDVLRRLIGINEAARCLSKICTLEALDEKFHDKITNLEALAFYVYSTASGWHSYINGQLWSGSPSRDVTAFARVLNQAGQDPSRENKERCTEVIAPMTWTPLAPNTFKARL
jgi:hypothetical protein